MKKKFILESLTISFNYISPAIYYYLIILTVSLLFSLSECSCPEDASTLSVQPVCQRKPRTLCNTHAEVRVKGIPKVRFLIVVRIYDDEEITHIKIKSNKLESMNELIIDAKLSSNWYKDYIVINETIGHEVIIDYNDYYYGSVCGIFYIKPFPYGLKLNLTSKSSILSLCCYSQRLTDDLMIDNILDFFPLKKLEFTLGDDWELNYSWNTKCIDKEIIPRSKPRPILKPKQMKKTKSLDKVMEKSLKKSTRERIVIEKKADPKLEEKFDKVINNKNLCDQINIKPVTNCVTKPKKDKCITPFTPPPPPPPPEPCEKKEVTKDAKCKKEYTSVEKLCPVCGETIIKPKMSKCCCYAKTMPTIITREIKKKDSKGSKASKASSSSSFSTLYKPNKDLIYSTKTLRPLRDKGKVLDKEFTNKLDGLHDDSNILKVNHILHILNIVIVLLVL